MKRFTRLGVGAAAVFVLCGLLAVTPAAAGTAQSVECASGSEIGAKVPTVFVHGLGADVGVWGDDHIQGSMYKYLAGMGDLFRTRFDYKSSNTQWVTNSDIGQRLAETIDCLSQSSLQGGGRGKVIAVGHSMGGLAIEYAASLTVNGRKIGDVLEHVITIASPFQGSILGNAGSMLVNSACLAVFPVGQLFQQNVTQENCFANLAVHGLSIGSEELKALPPFPANVSVKAIAGNVIPEIKLGFVTITGPPQNSDLVVGIDSATPSDRYTDQGNGDGEKIVECKGVIMEPILSDAPCAHTKILKDENVQDEVKKSIQDYIASTKVPVTNVYGLGLQLPSNWKVAENQEYRSYADDSWTVLYDSSHCDDPRLPEYCESIVVVNLNGPENKDPYGDPRQKVGEDCYGNHFQDDSYYGPSQTLQTNIIEGEEVLYQRQGNCSPDYDPIDEEYVGTRFQYSWRIPSRGIVLFTAHTEDSTVQTANDLIANATWQ